MSLSEINEELHHRSQEAEVVLPGESSPSIQPKSAIPEPTRVTAPEVPLGDAWNGTERREEPVAPGLKPRSPFVRLSRKFALIAGGVALALIVAGAVFKAGGWLFNPEQVQVTITGPKWTESNAVVEYVIRYENNNWVDLEDAELIITYPEMFRFAPSDGFQVSTSRAVLPLGTVKKSSLNSIVIKGSYRSFQDQVALLTATLRAAPKGVASRIDTEYRYSTAVESSAVIVELAAPQQAGDGQFVDYVVDYRNESAEAIENLELAIDYPTGFAYRESKPLPTRGENRWSIRSLAPGESGTVTVRGIITGAQGDVKRVLARVGVLQGDDTLMTYAEIERQTHVMASPLVIAQEISHSGDSNSVAPGQGLSYRLVFENAGDIGLRDLIVTVDLDPRYFDVSKINLNGRGAYNVAKQQVVFRAADHEVLSLLEPGRGGEIAFSVPVRSDLATYGKSNMEIESIAKIDSPDVPTPIGVNKIIASNRVDFKVRTIPNIELSGYHFDGNGNTGPVPPVVGQETTYTLNLRTSSTMNAITDGRVVLSVPGQVRYLKTQSLDQGSVIYNDRTGEIFWNIGTIPPGAGRTISLAIQIGLTPDPAQVGEEARLTNTVIFTGKDAWTDEELRLELSEKTTNLSEDVQLINAQGNKVQAGS